MTCVRRPPGRGRSFIRQWWKDASTRRQATLRHKRQGEYPRAVPLGPHALTKLGYSRGLRKGSAPRAAARSACSAGLVRSNPPANSMSNQTHAHPQDDE